MGAKVTEWVPACTRTSAQATVTDLYFILHNRKKGLSQMNTIWQNLQLERFFSPQISSYSVHSCFQQWVNGLMFIFRSIFLRKVFQSFLTRVWCNTGKKAYLQNPLLWNSLWELISLSFKPRVSTQRDKHLSPEVSVHSCDPSTWETESGEQRVEG